METLNKIYSPFNASNNMFESNIQALYKKDEALSNNQGINETSNIQYISALRNINEIRKFNEIRNAILSNKNMRNENSLMVSSSYDYGMMQNEQNSKINLAMDNMVKNQLINQIVNEKQREEISSINISNNLNILNQNLIYNLKKFNSQNPTSLNIMDNYYASSTLNDYSNINSTPVLSPLQVNSPLDLNSYYLNSSFSNSFPKTNNLLNKNQLQLLYLAKLFNDQKNNQLLTNKERKSKFNSITIPANDSITTSNLINNSMSIPLSGSMENNLTKSMDELMGNNLINNSLIMPTAESNENNLNNNSFVNSITIPTDYEEDKNEQLSDKLLKQFQLQERILASKINENSNSKEENEISSSNNFENTLLEMPSITLNNEEINLFKSPEINTQEDVNFDAVMNLNLKQNTLLSPELSPLFKSDNTSSSSNQMFNSCMKKSEFNVFSSMDTLNDILSITPDMETINTPVIDDKFDSFNNNIQYEFSNNTQSGFNKNFIDPFEAINGEVKESSNNLLTVEDNYLNIPATPNSISNSPNPSNFDLSDFPNIIPDSYEFNNGCNLMENININSVIDKEQENLMKSNENISPAIEPITITKKPRGRPRKKTEEIPKSPPKSPEEKMEQLSKTIDELLSSDLYAKLYSAGINEFDNDQKNQTKKVCFDKDYKFKKQVNTLNYILVSYKRMCSALSANDEVDKTTLMDVTENQYDIPEQIKSEKEEIKEQCDILEQNINEKEEPDKMLDDENNDRINNEVIEGQKENGNEIESDNEDEMDSISEIEESSDSESEVKSLSILRKEILETNSNTNDDNEDNKEEIIPIRSIETMNNGRKRKPSEDNDESSNEDKTKQRKIMRLSIKQIKNSLENGNRMSIGNGLGVNSVSALTKNGLVLVGRKRIIAENTNRPYVCSICGAGFVRKHDLNRHEKVHTGIKNYKCPYCDRAFSRNDALSRHLRVELKHRSQANEKKRGRKKSTKKEK